MGKSLVQMGLEAQAEVLTASDAQLASPAALRFNKAFDRLFDHDRAVVDEERGELGKAEAEQIELTATERVLLDNLKREHGAAQGWLDYRKRVMLTALRGSPTFTLELIEEYAEARAREILTRRALEGCGWTP